MSNWSQICSEKLNRPFSQQQQSNYSGCLFAVSFAQWHEAFTLTFILGAGRIVCACRNIQRDVVVALEKRWRAIQNVAASWSLY
jgi:hypothetical protein